MLLYTKNATSLSTFPHLTLFRIIFLGGRSGTFELVLANVTFRSETTDSYLVWTLSDSLYNSLL
jgi:hypothetical protein